MSARAYLVESIPKGLEELRGTPGIQYTEDVLTRLTAAATSTIDLTAMYWALLPDPTSDDEKGFTDAQFEAMGAGAGRALYQSLRDAARRGVRIRILQSPGFSGQKQESDTLRMECPEHISIHSIDMGQWYGGSGIMHQKIWIFDGRDIYIGSVNMDWKSITQVKEMGIAVEACPELAEDATKYFNGWCAVSELSASSLEVFDPWVRADRLVPPGPRWWPRRDGRSRRWQMRNTLQRTIFRIRCRWSSMVSREGHFSRDAPMKFAVRGELRTAKELSKPSAMHARPCA